MKLLSSFLALIVSATALHAQGSIPNIRINDDAAGAQQGGARIAIDRNGTLYVAWTDFRSNSKGDIYLSASTDGGITFSPDRAVYTGGTVQSGMERGVTMALDSLGGIHMVWMEAKRTNIPELRYSRSTDGGATFSAPAYIGGPAGVSAQDFPSMGIDAANNIYVAWVDDREMRGGTGTNTQIYFTRSTDRGGAFSPPMRASAMPGGVGGSCECCNTGMAVSRDGHVYISFRSNIDNRRDVFVARSLDRGESFEVAMPAASAQWVLPACPMSGSAIVLDNEETAHIVWRDARPNAPGQGHIYHSMLFYGASACTPDVRLETGLARGNFPSIAVTPGGAIVCSAQGVRGSASDVVAVYSFDGGNTFTPASNLADDPAPSARTEPVTITGPDGARYSVWVDTRRDNKGDIYFGRDTTTVTLTRPDRVSLQLPADGATIQAFEGFSWRMPANLGGARNVACDLTIVKDGTPTTVKDIRTASHTRTLAPGDYRWFVVAHTAVGRSEPSDTFSFTLAPQGSGVRDAASSAAMLRGVLVDRAADVLRVMFDLNAPGDVTLSVTGLDGRRRLALEPRAFGAGEQHETVDIRSLPSGAYILELTASGRRDLRKFMVVR